MEYIHQPTYVGLFSLLIYYYTLSAYVSFIARHSYVYFFRKAFLKVDNQWAWNIEQVPSDSMCGLLTTIIS
jgi:hypothetical protein